MIAGAGEEETFPLILTSFVNLVLRGGVPLPVRAHFFGARLFALSKPGGGLRPIAVGLTLRRLVAKVANRSAVGRCASFLGPRQLGVGVKGGCEAAVHAARSYLEGCPADRGILKVDYKNAFNCIRRDAVL